MLMVELILIVEPLGMVNVDPCGPSPNVDPQAALIAFWSAAVSSVVPLPTTPKALTSNSGVVWKEGSVLVPCEVSTEPMAALAIPPNDTPAAFTWSCLSDPPGLPADEIGPTFSHEPPLQE